MTDVNRTPGVWEWSSTTFDAHVMASRVRRSFWDMYSSVRVDVDKGRIRCVVMLEMTVLHAYLHVQAVCKSLIATVIKYRPAHQESPSPTHVRDAFHVLPPRTFMAS